MIPFRFGPAGEQLFGALHPAQPEGAPLGALLCPPFGQEAIRVHRFYRVLADRLARAGVPTMRFDFLGTGDADGGDLDGDLLRWRSNVLHADAALRQRSGCTHVVWIGARLGATLAAMASMEAGPRPPHALILWEPIADGLPYLRYLAQEHAQALSGPYRKRADPPGSVPRGEALGFGMSKALIAQIGSLAGMRLREEAARSAAAAGAMEASWASSSSLVVVAPEEDRARHAGWMARGPSQAAHRFVPLSVPFDWTSEEALNTALVPPAALQALLGSVEGLRA